MWRGGGGGAHKGRAGGADRGGAHKEVVERYKEMDMSEGKVAGGRQGRERHGKPAGVVNGRQEDGEQGRQSSVARGTGQSP